MKALLIGLTSAALFFATPARADYDNYLFGYSGGDYTRQLTLTSPSGTILLSAVDSGYFNQTGFHNSNNTNYTVGSCESCERSLFHNFFVFDLSGINAPISAATFTAYNPEQFYGLESAFRLWDVSQQPTRLDMSYEARDENGLGIYEDLGSGTLLGSRLITEAPQGTFVSVDFNVSGIKALNGSQGSLFAFGGSLTEVNLIPVVPEPATWIMLLLGFFSAGSALRSRKAKFDYFPP